MRRSMKFTLPYDKKAIDVEIDDHNLVGVLESKVEGYKPVGSQEELIEACLDNPIGSPKLEELAKGKRNIVIISSDHTRPVPSKIITPILLRRIREAEPDANIKILVATGSTGRRHIESSSINMVRRSWSGSRSSCTYRP